ncbi:unnamed protein product, partial [Prorocentrum cordatum]
MSLGSKLELGDGGEPSTWLPPGPRRAPQPRAGSAAIMLTALKKGDGGDDAKKPGGALLGLGGLGGLTGVGNLKSKLSTKLVTNKVDEAVWRSNLTDMHRVRNMARTLWLSLEHTNEAVMRVALEIVTCRKARKILWWNDDFWASEEGKPEHLRGVIEE